MTSSHNFSNKKQVNKIIFLIPILMLLPLQAFAQTASCTRTYDNSGNMVVTCPNQNQQQQGFLPTMPTGTDVMSYLGNALNSFTNWIQSNTVSSIQNTNIPSSSNPLGINSSKLATIANNTFIVANNFKNTGIATNNLLASIINTLTNGKLPSIVVSLISIAITILAVVAAIRHWSKWIIVFAIAIGAIAIFVTVFFFG